jgi:hypothetical protein
MIKKKYISYTIVFMTLIAVIFMSGCDSESKDRATVQAQQDQYAISQPVPHFDWSLERQTVIQIYAARNHEIATHSVWRSDYGMIEGDCDSIGFPIPYDVQLTNPLQPAYSGSGSVIEQAEPNGLFSSKTTSATWIRAVYGVNGEVKQVPVYVEGKVTCYPFPVDVNYTTNRVTPIENQEPSVSLDPSNNTTSYYPKK